MPQKYGAVAKNNGYGKAREIHVELKRIKI